MKKRLNSSILAATSLAAITTPYQTEASTLVLSEGQLSTLSSDNQLENSEVTTLDFSNMTPEIVSSLKLVPIDLSLFQNVRNIILPWFAANLNIKLPENFGTPVNDSYSRLTIVQTKAALAMDSDLTLNLETLLNRAGKVILDTKAVPVTNLKTGPGAAKIERNVSTVNVTVPDTLEAMDTDGIIPADAQTSITLIPSVVASDQYKPPFAGLPTSVLAANPSSLNISAYTIAGKDVTVSGMTNLVNLVTASGDSIGSLKVTGETTVTTNATSIAKIEFTSASPDQTVITTMAATATVVAVNDKASHIASFAGKTDLDFSKLDLGSVDATAARIKDILDGTVPIASIVSMKLSSTVLSAVMTKLNITDLSGFSALKRLDIVSATGIYQTTTLSASNLPSGLEEFYSSNLVVRKGTLSADLEFDSKFSAATLDLSGLDVNGHALTIAGSFSASSVNTLKLNPSLLAVAATKNLIATGTNKSIVVSGAASGALTTTNLQNVGTIDLRSVTGATSLSAPLNVDGNNSNLSNLYLPSAFNVEAAADILSGVDNGEVTVYLSGAYSDAKTLDASYDKTTLNFSGVTGTGRFQLPSGVRGLILSDAVKGINVGAAAVLNEFDLSGLTYIRQITDLPTSATVLKLNNTSASAALQLNLTALTSLTTLQLGSGRVSQLSLPASAILTNGGEVEHLDLSNVTDLAVLTGLNALLAEGLITQVSFPNSPASTLHINLVDTISGIQFNNLDKIPELTIDSDYSPGENMWPTVKSKSSSADWSNLFNYIIAPVLQGGINSPSIFDLSGQAIENQTQADALIIALNDLSQAHKSVIQKTIIRLDAAAAGAIDLSGITTTDFTHGSLKIIIDQSTGSTATVSVPGGWTAKTKTHISLDQVVKTTTASWTNYLNYRFASTDNKGQGATSLDLSSIDLTSAQWSALMTSLNSFSSPELIETIHLKLVAANDYSSAPAFTTATLSAATSIIVDITGVKNSGVQVNVTRLPSATVNLQVEQRITGSSSVDRATASSWKGYIEYLLSNISGSNYTLDLTASDVRIQSAAQLTALNSALAGLSAANKAKIQNINLKIESGNRAADFTVSTNFTGFTNIASLVIDATGALNGTAQSAVTFSLTNAPAYAKTHVTSLASVDTDVSASWAYYLAYRLATDGVGLTNLDVSTVSLASQDDLTAFLTALNNQSGGDKSDVQSIKLKLDSDYVDNTVDFGVDLGSGQISGLDNGSFAVEVDRNGANSTTPIPFAFGTAITTNNTTIKDTAFTGLASFDATNSHHWLGYARALLSTLTSGTTTLDLSVHSALELNNANVAKFIAGMNALPDADKAKVDTLKIKLASGNFGASTADLSGLSGFTALTNLVVDRNGARTSAMLYDPAVSISGSGTITVNDPELRTVSLTNQTNQWLGYLRFVLNGMSDAPNTLDLSAFAIDNADSATAFNNAFQALPSDEKLKIQTLKLSASAAITLGTSVTGFTNLTKVIVDQTAAPTAAITMADDFGTTQKFYVTSASTSQTNGAWAKYIDYAMSSVADGGLNQTAFDLTGLTLNSTEVGQFFSGFTVDQAAAVTSVSLKLATAFGANPLTLPVSTGFTSLTGADTFKLYRNAAANAGTLVSVDYNGWDDSVVQIIDPTATTVADQTSAQDWLGYLTGVLNDAAAGYVLDLRNRTLSASGHIDAVNAALNALDTSLKDKVAELWLSVTAAGELGTGVSGFTNLTKVIVDQTMAPTAAITMADDFGTTQKFYVTSASTTQTSDAWAMYIDYAMSSVADGGLNQTTFDLTGLTLNSTEVGQFFSGFTVDQAAAVTSVSLKLATVFGANSLTLPLSTGFTSLTGADAFKLYRNAAANAGTLVSVNYNGWDDSVVQIIDPTATTVADQTKSQDWLQYLSYVTAQPMFDATSGFGAQSGVLDLSSTPLTSSDEAVAFITALELLDSSLKAKLTAIDVKLATGDFGIETLDLQGDLSSEAGFTNLSKFMVNTTGTETDVSGTQKVVDFSGLLVDGSKDMWVTSLASVDYTSANAAASWLAYIHYQIRNDDTNFTLDTSTLNGGAGLTVAQAGYLCDALATLSATGTNKGRLTSVNVKLATAAGAATLAINHNLGNLNGLTSIVIDATDAMHAGAQVAVTFSGTFHATTTTKKAIVSSLSSVDKDNQNSWTYYFNTAAMPSVDVSSIPLTSAETTAFLAAVGTGTTAKAGITSLTMKLATAFGANSLTLPVSTGFTSLTGADAFKLYRNAAANAGTLVSVDYNGWDDSVVQLIDPTATTVADQTSAQQWLGYLTGVLNDTASGYVLDLRNRTLSASGHIDAVNAAFNALDSSLKDKVAELWLTVTAAGELGTGVSGFTNLTKVIVDQTAAPTAVITIAASTVATGEFADAATQKFYVTSASTAQTNNAWAMYIDYSMSSVADGGLNQTTFDLTGLTLNSTEVGQFFSGFTVDQAAAVTSVSLKLATAFGANSLTLPDSSGFTSLTGADAFKLYRNAAANAGTLVSVDYNGWDDSVVQIIDPTATTVADTAEAQQWLGYLTGILNDAAAGATLDLSSIAIDDAQAVTAFNNAIVCLDSDLSNKVSVLKLAVTHAANIVVGTGVSGFGNLSRIELSKPATHTVTFADALNGQRTHLTNFNSVKMDTAADWIDYLNYMLSATINGGQNASSLNLNNRTFASQSEIDAFFAGLNALDNTGFYADKSALTTLRIKLANGVDNAEIGRINNTSTAATGLATGLHVIVDPNGSTDTIHAGANADEVQADNLIVLSSTPAFTKHHFAYVAEQGSFTGTLDLTGLNLDWATGTNTLVQELNLLSDDIQAKINTINLKLQSGAFGSSTLTLGALTGFTGVTFNVDRNGAVDNDLFGALVTITNTTGHTVNLTDAEFHNMSTFDNELSENWIGYLTHELNSAAASYTLDLTVHPELTLDSANSVSAFSSALRYLPDSLKTKVALLKIKSSTNGDFGATDLNGPGSTERVIPEYAAFDNLASVVIEYTATGLNMGAYVGHITNTNKYAYVTTPFNGMDWNDWTKFFNYQLNAANIGGLELTDIVLAQRLSSSDLTAVLSALDAASQKALLQNLTLNLASDVVGDINVGASVLTGLTNVIINTNGSVAKITPTNSFVGKTTLNSINNVKTDNADSWGAYFKGQSSIAAIDVREVELADQAQLTAFLTALNAESRKATVDTIKLKLASSYAGTASFATVNPAGLTTLDDAGIEIHRNGSTATTVQGGDITTAKIKIVDLTASSLTDRSSDESWRRYLTALVEDGGFAGSIDLALDSDTYLRTNAHLTAFMSGLNNLSPANKLLVTSLKLELAPGAAWSDITNLGQGLTGFDNLTSFITDATGATVSGTQVTVAFDADISGASPKAIVTGLASVDKDSQDSWTYFFNSSAMTSVDVSSITLTNAEASAFFAALGSGVTAKADITSLTMKLDPTFGAASLTFDANNDFTNLATIIVHRNGAANTGTPISMAITNTTASVGIVDPTISDADAVLKTSASSWLAYLTDALTGAVTELDLTDDNLVLGTVGQTTALSSALDALDSTLKAKVATLKIKAAANVTVSATLMAAGGFSALTVIELDKPAANTITVSTIDATTQLRIANLAKVKRDSSDDWLAYVQYLMKDLGAVTNFDLDMTSSSLAEGELQAFVDSLVTLSQNANSSDNRDKIQKVRLKLAPGAWTADIANLGTGWSASMSNIDTFTVDTTGTTVSGTQLYVGFHADLTNQSEYTKAFVTSINSVDKDSAASWVYYLNHLTKDGAAGLDLSANTLTLAEFTAVDTALNTFSTASGNDDILSSIHIKVSGAAGASTVNLTADLDAQTTIDSAGEFIVDVSGFTHANSQATVDHTGGTPKAIELRIAGASDLYRDSSDSWGMYLNSLYAGGIPATSTLDFSGSSATYLRNQADVNALMTAIESRDDKANIDILNVRLAPGSVGSDITFGIGVTGIDPAMGIDVTGATNNGSMITSADIHYAGSFESAGKVVTQTFANNVADHTSAQNWTKYLTYLLSSTADGGLGRVAIVTPALTSSAELTALATAIDGLSNTLKDSIQHLHLDVSHANFNGALTLGTGISGLSNLIEVTYARASAQADATAAVVGAGDFSGKIQRLRTAWNADTLASAATVVEYLRYILMDAAMGGLEETLVDLTLQTLDNTQDGYVYNTLDPNNQNPLSILPTELKSRITELRLNFNTTIGGTYTGITIPNLTTVKYFQTGSAVFLAPSSTTTVTTNRFRALLADVADKTVQSEWSEYIDYVLTSSDDGGLGQTTFDLSSLTLTSAQIVPFLAALDAHALAANVTALTLKLDPTFGAASLDMSGYTNLTGLGANTVEIRRNAAVHAATPVTITYGGSFTDANVKIIDPETNTTADKDNTRQQWLEYLTYTINTVGLTGGLLTVAPGDAFTSQAHIYSLFDAMEALDSSLKAQVVIISINLSSIAGGTVSLMQTGDVALTGFDNLTKVIYMRAGIDTNVGSIVTDLSTALKGSVDLDNIPTWVRADNDARDTAIDSALQEGNEVWSAIRASDAAELKSQLITKLANGITFPASDACDADVDTAAGDVSVTVDGDVKNTLATTLVPVRGTNKITAIETALSTAFTNGGTTGLGTLPWLKSAWAGYVDHDAVMADVLADGDVSTAISTESSTIADIKTAVTTKLNSMLIPTSGQLDTLIGAIDLTILAGWNNNADTFVSDLRNKLNSDLGDLMPWFDSDDITDPDSIIDFISSTMFNLTVYFGGTNPAAGKWDLGNSGAAIKAQITPDIKTGFGAVVSPDASSAAGKLASAIDAAFAEADTGNALTINTAAWARPTAAIEADLTTSIQTALTAFPWYTGVAATQAAAAVAAGDVANQDAATIISNIKTYLTDNVSRPTADSIFSAGVNTVVDSINLAVVSTAVTTDFAGVAETLSRYRVNAADVISGDDSGHWTDFLNYQLNPASEGGLNATTLDITGTSSFGNDKKTNFMSALSNLSDANRHRITSIKLAVNDAPFSALDGNARSFNDNLKIIMDITDRPSTVCTLTNAFKEDGTTPLISAEVIDIRITTARTVSATAMEWTCWLNHKLSSTFGGEGVTAIDLSATHAFTSQAQLNTFFEGLDALDGTGAMANKNVLASLTLKLAAGDFGAASARIGYTGSAAVTGLKSDIAIIIDRNGARNGANTESAIVTINHSDIDAVSSVDGVTVDNTDAVDVDNLSSSAEWLEYLNSTLTAAGAAYTLDLTGAGFELQPGTSAIEATALFNALQALNPTLKAKIDTLKIKLAVGDHGANFITNPNLAGFTNLTAFIVDATGALNGSAQSTISFNFTNEPGSLTTKEAHVASLASVDLASAAAISLISTAIANIQSGDLSSVSADLATTVVEIGNMDQGAATTAITAAQLGLTNAIAALGLLINPALGVDAYIADAITALTNAQGRFTYAQQRVDMPDWPEALGALTTHVDPAPTNAQACISTANTALDDAMAALTSANPSIASWSYYLNYLKETDGNLESIDLSALDLYNTDEPTTQSNIDAFFAALQERTDRTTVKDIFIDVHGLIGGTNVDIGSTTTTLTSLTSVVIRRDGTTTFAPAGNVAATDLAVINSAMGTLGANGTVAQWKGYLAYLLENAAHGGAYTGSNPIAINLTATALQVNSLAVLQALETAIAELPARLKARISTILIKTTETSVDYTAGAYEFGDAFTAPILTELSELKAVIIESCTEGTDPVFDTDGNFFNESSISKIVYHTTINVA